MDREYISDLDINLLNFDLCDQLVAEFQLDPTHIFRLADPSLKVTVEPIQNLVANQTDFQNLLTARAMEEFPTEHISEVVTEIAESRDDDGYETSSTHADCGSEVSAEDLYGSGTGSLSTRPEPQVSHHLSFEGELRRHNADHHQLSGEQTNHRQCSEDNIDLDILQKMVVQEFSSIPEMIVGQESPTISEGMTIPEMQPSVVRETTVDHNEHSLNERSLVQQVSPCGTRTMTTDQQELSQATAILMRMTATTRPEGILDQYETDDIGSVGCEVTVVSEAMDEIGRDLFPELSQSPRSNCSEASYETRGSDTVNERWELEIRSNIQQAHSCPDIPAPTFASDQSCGPLPEFNVLLDRQSHTYTPAFPTFAERVPTPDLNKLCQIIPSNHVCHVVDAEDDDDDDDKSIMLEDILDEDYTPSGGRCGRNLAKDRVSKSETRHKKEDWPFSTADRRSRRTTLQLWKFLLNALCTPSLNPSVIEWKDVHHGVFRLSNTKRISKMWGDRISKSNKKPMTYEKFSRAIRYYYDKKVIMSHRGRLTYQFGPNAIGWKSAALGNSRILEN